MSSEAKEQARSIFADVECKGGAFDLNALRQCQAVGFFYSSNADDACRKFIPILKGFYTKINEKEKKFEIIYISGDELEPAFRITADRLGCPFVPFAKCTSFLEGLKKNLGFNKQEYPKLILVNPATENLITKFGVERIFEDVQGNFFPWKPQLSNSIGKDFINGSEKTVGINFAAYAKNARNNYHIALFFGSLENHHVISQVQVAHSHWFAKCFLIVVGMDDWGYQFQKWIDPIKIENKKQADKWLKIPFADGPRRQGIMDSLGVKELPALVLLDAQLNVVHPNALGALISDPTGEKFPWTLEEFPAVLPDLSVFKPADQATVDNSVPEEHTQMIESLKEASHPAEQFVSLEEVQGTNLAEKLKKVRKSGVWTLKHQFDLNAAKKIFLETADEDEVSAAGDDLLLKAFDATADEALPSSTKKGGANRRASAMRKGLPMFDNSKN